MHPAELEPLRSRAGLEKISNEGEMPSMKYKTEPLKLWNRAKEIRNAFYQNYVDAHKNGGLRWAGGAWTFDAIPAGLGDDVYSVTSEPYAASIAFQREFSKECLEAAEKAGYARDLCAYMRNYWGSILLDKWAFADDDGKRIPFPEPDFIWQDHICCSHAKWYQVVRDIKGDIPMFCVDVASGPYIQLNENRLNYVAGQLIDGIEWLEKTTCRRFDDQKFIDACWNDFRSTHTWAKICELNQAVPAPLDEKTMYSLYVLATLQKSWKVVADFYDDLFVEVADRVKRGIVAVTNERCRVMSDTQPPWGFLKIFRYMGNYGCVSVGSLYTFGLEGMWIWEDAKPGTAGTATPKRLIPRPMPPRKPTSREEACRMLADWHLCKPQYQHFYHPKYKNDYMTAIARQWKLDGIMLHYNRGCEGLSLGIAENRLALQAAGFPVMTFEGNMGDEREFDESRARERIDSFMETLGIKQIGGGT